MSALLSHRNGSAAFVQLTRLFAGLKRSGRVMDVVWFQSNPEYARAILALADENDDEAVREIAATLRKLIPDFLAEPAAAKTTGRFAAVSPPAEPKSEVRFDENGDPILANQYIGRLR